MRFLANSIQHLHRIKRKHQMLQYRDYSVKRNTIYKFTCQYAESNNGINVRSTRIWRHGEQLSSERERERICNRMDPTSAYYLWDVGYNLEFASHAIWKPKLSRLWDNILRMYTHRLIVNVSDNIIRLCNT